MRLEINPSLIKLVLKFWVTSIMRCKLKGPCVSKNDWRCHLSVCIDLAVYTIANTKIGACTAEDHILTAFKGHTSRCSREENSAIHTFGYL